MKKLLLASALSLATAAFAAGPTLGVSYDLDNAHANDAGFHTKQEVKVSLAQATKLGTFDAGLTGVRFHGQSTDYATGYELGYGGGLALGQVGLSGRVAYGRLNQVDPTGGGFLGSAKYWSAAAEAQLPLTASLNGFVGYRHRQSVNQAAPISNRYTAGVDYALNRDVSLRVGYARTTEGNLTYNGLTSALAYSF